MLGFFLFSVTGMAEYRVFLLKISKKKSSGPESIKVPGLSRDPSLKNEQQQTSEQQQLAEDKGNKNQPPSSGDYKTVTSTLDPVQYRYYFQVKEDEEISYIDTWMCYGRTNGQALCANPGSKSTP